MKKLMPAFFIGLALVGLIMILLGCDDSSGDGNGVSPGAGTGGSMARFAVTGNTLYIVSRNSLEVYDVTEANNPQKSVSKNLGLGIETIFPYQDNLFIGASDGMYIYNNANPRSPEFISRFTHIQSCDPVVVQGKYAYVTLRNGVQCRPWNSLSSLDVVDISDKSNPKMVSSQPMLSPYGLGVSGNKLFVCEGDKGFKVMDVTNPEAPTLKTHFEDLPSYDVIAKENHLILTGKQGLFQYHFDESDSLEMLSKIPVL